jgi:RHS repeat-associated protein
MRRLIVIILLGLMTTLSLPAFANAESRESSHAIQPYKYIGKELDRTHGLDWYDHSTHHYDPVTGRWNAVDALAEKYYVWSHDERASRADGLFSKKMGGLPVLVIGKTRLLVASIMTSTMEEVLDSATTLNSMN